MSEQKEFVVATFDNVASAQAMVHGLEEKGLGPFSVQYVQSSANDTTVSSLRSANTALYDLSVEPSSTDPDGQVTVWIRSDQNARKIAALIGPGAALHA